jgi:phosphate regulon transcriptional regulator PhoB
MSGEKILIVEDDEDIAEMITYNLKKEGYRISSVHNGEDALNLLKSDLPDMIILDLMLPKIDGLEVCRNIRRDQNTAGVPVIMLTARCQEADKIAGLELGADDYVTKPFSPGELIARIRAILRRAVKLHADEAISSGELLIDAAKYKVTISGLAVNLTATEFKLLEYMARRPGEVLTRDKILNDVFGYEHSIYDRTVDTHIKTLRKKLDKARDYIETIRGVGYRFRESQDGE